MEQYIPADQRKQWKGDPYVLSFFVGKKGDKKRT
jgi:hypothetical protein